MVSVDEYLKSKIQKKTLPSGLEITVKKISPYISMQIKSELSKNDVASDTIPVETINRLFKAYVKSPIIPDEMGVEDFDSTDFNFIYSLILDQINFKRTKEMKDVVDSDKDFFLSDTKNK